jgi:DNA repair protein SbcC/Rad50
MTGLRRDSKVAAAEKGVAAVRARLEEEQAAATRTSAELDKAAEQSESLAEDPVAYSANASLKSQLALELQRQQFVIAKLKAQLVEAEDARALAAFRDAVAAAGVECAAARKASAEFDEQERRLWAVALALEERRQARAAATALASELRPEGAEWPDVEQRDDEPDWLEADARARLADLIQAGPLQPAAKTSRDRQAQEAHQRSSDRAMVKQAAEQGGSAIDRIPARLQDEARRLREELLAQQDVANRAASPLRYAAREREQLAAES